MAWRLAEGLKQLRAQINNQWPRRSKVSDGSIGDTAHSARASDHNPNSAGVVTAIDVTHDIIDGPDGAKLSRAVISDPRVKYVIFHGEIWKARTGLWERYRGANAHNHHVHISIKSDLADNTALWSLDAGAPAVSYPVLKVGSRGQAVRTVQEKLGVTIDGVFGPKTAQAVREFQGALGLAQTGVVDGETWKQLE